MRALRISRGGTWWGSSLGKGESTTRGDGGDGDGGDGADGDGAARRQGLNTEARRNGGHLLPKASARLRFRLANSSTPAAGGGRKRVTSTIRVSVAPC